MSVNGINLAIGQKWLTRDGQEVEIVGNDDHSIFPWDLSNGGSVTDKGYDEGMEFPSPDDLITLLQDEHGFIPWNGGECPVGYGVEVEVKFSCGKIYKEPAGNFYWGGMSGADNDIIAYRVVKQEVEPVKVGGEEEPKYTVDEMLQAFGLLTGRYAYATDEVATVKKHLAKTQDPDYKLYLELKAKFESYE